MLSLLLKLGIGLVGLLALSAAMLLIMRRADEREIDRLWKLLKARPAAGTFSPEMVADLPAPARRYFLHAITPGTSLSTTVHLRMSGSFRLQPEAAWLPMQAEQILAPPQGFVWKARVGKGLWLDGGDRYAEGQGRMRIWLWGILPVVNASGSDITRGQIGRLAAESIWAPAALLPRHGVSWEAVSDEAARARLEIAGEPVELTVYVDPEGRLRGLTLLRWGDRTDDGRYGYVPFGGEFAEERTFGGYTIPTQISAGWWFGAHRYFEFFRARIEAALFR
jgi:hypothetical protein